MEELFRDFDKTLIRAVRSDLSTIGINESVRFEIACKTLERDSKATSNEDYILDICAQMIKSSTADFNYFKRCSKFLEYKGIGTSQASTSGARTEISSFEKLIVFALDEKKIEHFNFLLKRVNDIPSLANLLGETNSLNAIEFSNSVSEKLSNISSMHFSSEETSPPNRASVTLHDETDTSASLSTQENFARLPSSDKKISKSILSEPLSPFMQMVVQQFSSGYIADQTWAERVTKRSDSYYNR